MAMAGRTVQSTPPSAEGARGRDLRERLGARPAVGDAARTWRDRPQPVRGRVEGAYPAQRGGVESQTGDLSISPRWQTSTIAEAAALLLRAQSLYEHGVPQAELRKALVDTPAGLLDR